MEVRALVFGVGDVVAGCGRVVGNSGGTWFEPRLPALAVGYAGGRPAPKPSDLAVPVAGVDLNRVAGRYERDGSVEGWTTLTGEWLGSAIRVESQSDAQPPPLRERLTDWTVPPCRPTASGWPRGQENANLIFDPGDLEENGAAVAVTVFRPSVDRQVLVVAAVDVAAVEARLRPQLGDRLCVIPARWTKPQLDTAFGHLQDRWQHWKLYAASPHNDEYGQPSIHARLVRITREIADWIDTCPDGLVTLTPWLTPLDR